MLKDMDKVLTLLAFFGERLCQNCLQVFLGSPEKVHHLHWCSAEDRGATKRKLQSINGLYITKHGSGFHCTRIQRRRRIRKILKSLNTEVINKA